MIFSSSIFLFFFLPVFLIVYFILPSKIRLYWALAASLLFFAWGAPVFVFIEMGCILVNFLLTGWMQQSGGKKRKLLLAVAVTLQLAALLYFKYAGFFIENANAVLSALGIGTMGFTELLLPLGISFITFHQISYTLDVYRGEAPAYRNIADFALYILYFPKLIAGPIVRHAEMYGQISNRAVNETINNRLSGFSRFCIGLTKKVLIANVLGTQADLIFAQDVSGLSSPVAWIGLLSFSFQIYFDFSAYSDMAIGLGRMTGFLLPENFNSPYVSTSITDFWRRWHITLGAWLREYLYMPLAIRTRNWGKAGIFFSLMLTFILCGMWHKPGWNFIVWGAFQGLFLIADQVFLMKFLKKTGKLLSVIITFFIILMGWVIFRTDDLLHTSAWFQKLFAFDTQFCEITFNPKFWTALAAAAIFSFMGGVGRIEKLQGKFFNADIKSWKLISLVFLGIFFALLSISSITAYGFHPFIYFKF